MNDQIIEAELPPVVEPKVSFFKYKDHERMTVINEDVKETLVEISGYDLQVKFNMKYLSSVEEIELACEGIADLFRQEIIAAKMDAANKTKE